MSGIDQDISSQIVARRSEERKLQTLELYHLQGSQAEMGGQHGELVRQAGDYEAVVDYYPRMPEILLRRSVPEGVARRAAVALLRPLIRAGLRRLEKSQDREFSHRSRAFFEALGLPGHLGRHLFVMDLFQNIIGLAGRWGLVPLKAAGMGPSCSSIAVWGEASTSGDLLHARNFDFPGVGLWERHPVVVFCTPKRGLRYGFVTTRGADVPGVTAFNEAGITVAAHTCLHRDVTFKGRGIIDLGHEIARRAANLEEAIRIARDKPAASSWGLVISSGRQRSAVVLEIAGRRLEVRRPESGEDYLIHANRYRQASLLPGEVSPSPGYVMNCEGRFRVMRRRVQQAAQAGGLGAEDLKRLLGSNEDPDLLDSERACGGVLAQGYTVKSVVFEPERGLLHLSVGDCPTGNSAYVEVPWDWDRPVGRTELDLQSLAKIAPKSSRFVDGAGRAGVAAYVDAVRLEGTGASDANIAQAVDQAAAADPDEPGYRIMTGAFRLRNGDLEGGLSELLLGLERERSPFHRGQLLLWASRAAAALGRNSQKQEYLDEFLGLGHPLLAGEQDLVRRGKEKRFTKSKLRRIVVHTGLPAVTLS